MQSLAVGYGAGLAGVPRAPGGRGGEVEQALKVKGHGQRLGLSAILGGGVGGVKYRGQKVNLVGYTPR